MISGPELIRVTLVWGTGLNWLPDFKHLKWIISNSLKEYKWYLLGWLIELKIYPILGYQYRLKKLNWTTLETGRIREVFEIMKDMKE